MKAIVVDHIWITYTMYKSVHQIGIVCDNGRAYACTDRRPIPKLGQEVDQDIDRTWNLQGDRYHPLTKLHKHLAGLEHEI
jgi:hypothetical protein